MTKKPKSLLLMPALGAALTACGSGVDLGTKLSTTAQEQPAAPPETGSLALQAPVKPLELRPQYTLASLRS